MTRYCITLSSKDSRNRAVALIHRAPNGTRLELKAQKRSNDQNKLLWELLSTVAMQKEHFGRRYTPETWKILFMTDWQRETTLIPNLAGDGIVPLTRSSDLSKAEMTDLIEFILSWGAQNQVVFHDQPVTTPTQQVA